VCNDDFGFCLAGQFSSNCFRFGGILGIAEVALFNRPDSLPIAQPKVSKHMLPVAEHHV